MSVIPACEPSNTNASRPACAVSQYLWAGYARLGELLQRPCFAGRFRDKSKAGQRICNTIPQRNAVFLFEERLAFTCVRWRCGQFDPQNMPIAVAAKNHAGYAQEVRGRT